MTHKSYDVAALIGSRICHDLISPIGAISNGVELLSMGGMGDGAEISLISDSVSHANARIRYFRIAFGAGNDSTQIAATEIDSVFKDLSASGRLNISWQAPGDPTRNDAKLAFLLIMCLESAMPYGGDVLIGQEGAQWRVTGEADKLKVDPDLWHILSAPESVTLDILPAQVQFLLAAEMLAARSPKARVVTDATRIEVVY